MSDCTSQYAINLQAVLSLIGGSLFCWFPLALVNENLQQSVAESLDHLPSSRLTKAIPPWSDLAKPFMGGGGGRGVGCIKTRGPGTNLHNPTVRL